MITGYSSFTTSFWLKMGLLGAAFVFSFYNAILSLIDTWMRLPTYSHGFLIPLISGYFIWAKKDQIKKVKIKPFNPFGLIVVLTSCLMLTMGQVSSVLMVQQISILILIPGVVLMLFGFRFLLALFFPLAYLVLMVPVFDVVINRIQWPLQILSATASANFLNLIGIPAFLTGNYIELPNITLEVAKACSGAQYLISIVAIAVPLMYFFIFGWVRRSVFMVLAVTIGIVTNWLRVILIGIWAQTGGEVLHGPMHIFQGLFVSVVGFGFIFIIASILSGKPPVKTLHHSHPA